MDANRTRKEFVADKVLQMVWDRVYVGEGGGRGHLPTDNEVQLRQLPRELHPGRHEAREGQGRARGGLRAQAGRGIILFNFSSFSIGSFEFETVRPYLWRPL